MRLGAYEIDGAAAGTGFGANLIGLGSFYQPSGGPGLLSTAVLTSTVYAFAGQSPAGALSATAANDSAVTIPSDRYGNSLGLLGAMGTSPDAITIGALGAKYVDVYFGTTVDRSDRGADRRYAVAVRSTLSMRRLETLSVSSTSAAQ